MADQAKVTSLDALETFRAQLIVFLSKARRSVDEVRDATRRTKQWLENDQQLHWESQIKIRRRAFDLANQEYFSARLSEFGDKMTRQQRVRKCKAALEEAEEKLRATKKWNQNFESLADPLSKRLEQLRQFLDDDMPKAVNYLVQAQRTLEDYAGVHGPVMATGPTGAAIGSTTGAAETEAHP